jgi:hypothetical protein
MKNLLITSCLAVLVIAMAGCGGNGTTEKKLESKGYFGKLAAIKAAYRPMIQQRWQRPRPKPNRPTTWWLPIEINKLEEDAKAVSRPKLPKLNSDHPSSKNQPELLHTLLKIQKNGSGLGQGYLRSHHRRKTDSENTMGGQNVQFTVPALMLDENGKVIKDHSYDAWLIWL